MMTALYVNVQFPSMADFKLALRNWAIVDKFEYRWSFCDTTRARAVCVHKQCPFTIRCNWYPKIAVAKVTVVVRDHNCIGEGIVQRSVASQLSWLITSVPSIMTIDSSTTTLSIINTINLHYG
jgi:MuDR family transposase